MARSKKKKKSKKPTRAKAAPKKTATKKSRNKVTKRTRKPSAAKKSAKKVATKKKATVRKPQRPAPPQVPQQPKGFSEKVRDGDVGTGIWFIVAGSVEHAVIQRRGSDGVVVVRTDAGVTELVPSGNLFETADEARAARHR